jgi:hypothetical protein
MVGPAVTDSPAELRERGAGSADATETGPPRLRTLDFVTRAKVLVLIALMAIGSALMWLGMPVLWLWLASRLQSGASPTLGPYVLVAVGLPLSMVLIGRGLAGLDRSYGRTIGFEPNARRTHRPWLKSMRGDRDEGHKRTVLDVVMIASVVVAWSAFGIWFFFFAGSSLPS